MKGLTGVKMTRFPDDEFNSQQINGCGEMLIFIGKMTEGVAQTSPRSALDGSFVELNGAASVNFCSAIRLSTITPHSLVANLVV